MSKLWVLLNTHPIKHNWLGTSLFSKNKVSLIFTYYILLLAAQIHLVVKSLDFYITSFWSFNNGFIESALNYEWRDLPYVKCLTECIVYIVMGSFQKAIAKNIFSISASHQNAFKLILYIFRHFLFPFWPPLLNLFYLTNWIYKSIFGLLRLMCSTVHW